MGLWQRLSLMLGMKRPLLAEAIPLDLLGSKEAVSAVVDGVYSALLSRPPTNRERSEAVALINHCGSASVLAEQLANKVAFKERVNDVRTKFGLSEDRFINDVTQNGEIEILLKRIVNKACPTRVVVDAGARARAGSNSYDLLRYLGWYGLLIEANPELIEGLQKEFEGLNCVIESCAVSDHEGEAIFNIGISDDVSSLDAGTASQWGPTFKEVKVSVFRLESLLARHAVPHKFDLLSLDIEGHDIRVLNDLVENTPYRPAWIILEGPSGGFEVNLETIGCAPLVLANYQVVDNTIANLILERRQL